MLVDLKVGLMVLMLAAPLVYCLVEQTAVLKEHKSAARKAVKLVGALADQMDQWLAAHLAVRLERHLVDLLALQLVDSLVA
jgi:hypothetical protein